MPLFLGKNYGTIYSSILGLIEKTVKDLYHGLRLQSQLAEWVQDAWYVCSPAAKLVNFKLYICTGGQHKLWILILRGTTIWRLSWNMLITCLSKYIIIDCQAFCFAIFVELCTT